MAWRERRSSWDYSGQEEDIRTSSHGPRHPDGDYPHHGQRTRSHEYSRSYSDYQSDDSRDGRAHRHPPYGSNNDYTGGRHQNHTGSHAYPRNYGRYDSYNDSPDYPRDQDYHVHSPLHQYQPRQYPRESNEGHYASDTRDHGYQAYPPPQGNQGREFYRHRGSQPRFNNKDRGRHTRDFHNYPQRSNAYPERSPVKTDDQEFDWGACPESRKDEQAKKFPNSPLDRQKSEPYYPLSRLPKARSRCSSSGSEHSKTRDDCVICYATITHLAITPCEHSYCHLCCVRLLILCEDHHCPICRTPFEENPVVLLHQPACNLLYKDLVGNSRYCNEYSLALVPPITKRFIDELFDLKCSIDDCQFSPRSKNFYHLEKHLKFTHDQYYCHVCLSGLKQFVFEMRLYSRDELNLHKDGKGDNRLDPPGHKGHPLCRFCKERLLDETTLYEHLHKNHFWCYICERNGVYMYYQNQEELRTHFRKDHFLCERGECRNEVFTSVFSSNIDLKAHISSVHAGDLKKNEARNLRRVELEFNYGHSAHQTDGEQGQGYRERERRQPRERRGNERTDHVSDEDEINPDSFEPTTEPIEREYAFENEENESNLNPETENINSNIGACDDEKIVLNETEAALSEPSIDNSADNWPQVGDKSVPVSSSQKPTPDVPIPGPPEPIPSALLYSKSLGLAKQSLPSPKQTSRVQASQAPLPSPYSDVLKPESHRSQKLQSQSQDSSQDSSKRPPKQTYEDVFPALCSANIPPVPPHPDKQAPTHPNTSLFPHAKTGKKSNKQRKKDNYKSNQAPIVKPNTPSSQSNSTGDFPNVSKPPKDKHGSHPTVNLADNAKVKSKSPSLSKKLNSGQQNGSKKESQSNWVPPQNYKQRKSALNNYIHSMSKTNPRLLEYDSKRRSLMERSCTAKEFFQFCVNSFGLSFSSIFPELLVLIPDINLQQELLRAKDQLYPSAILLAFAPSSSSWSSQAHIQFDTCPICGQVILPSDLLPHNSSHSTDNEFPALC